MLCWRQLSQAPNRCRSCLCRPCHYLKGLRARRIVGLIRLSRSTVVRLPARPRQAGGRGGGGHGGHGPPNPNVIKYEKMQEKCRELWGFFFLVLTLKSCAIKANSVHRRLGLEIMYRIFLSLHRTTWSNGITITGFGPQYHHGIEV